MKITCLMDEEYLGLKKRYLTDDIYRVVLNQQVSPLLGAEVILPYTLLNLDDQALWAKYTVD
jgi:hypothetical protein